MLIAMNQTSPRKRQPDITQQRLLDVAGELVTESGVAALTLDAVAKRAGVSKGGLLHHFPSKNALLAAMVGSMVGKFSDAADAFAPRDPDRRGRGARAYVRTTVEGPPADARRWAALSAAFMTDPSLLEGWRAKLAELCAADRDESTDPVTALIVRLAADGLWLADVCRLYTID